MHATEVSRIVGQRLIDAGFRGVIAVDEARKIVTKIQNQFSRSGFSIAVELAPIHRVGKSIQCDCARSTIKVEPRQPKPKTPAK